MSTDARLAGEHRQAPFRYGVVLVITLALFPAALTFAVVMLLLAAVPVALVGGLLRLVREKGANVQAVAGDSRSISSPACCSRQ